MKGHVLVESRATLKRMIEIAVNFLSQLQECTARREFHLGDVFFKKEKHILNGILQLIFLNFFLYSNQFTKTAT